jgi:WhiB family redox-sensing transcriptional regulator
MTVGTDRTGEVAMADVQWRQRGACRGLDPGIFYPDTDEEADEAKAVCAECGVRVACLEHALTIREKQGVWGGATERERRRIIRQRRRSA